MLENLSPSSVWSFFEQFCSIPHPSGYEEKAADYIRACANQMNLPSVTDDTGNILIRKNASDSSYTTPIVLQSHLDMVPQKNEGTTHDFTTDPIRPYINGEWVKAQGTTLGADNGIGVAIALAVLQSNSIKHGPIEALFTLDEERGMTGAFGLTKDFIIGRKLINLDTEEEHEICIGCAGGTDIRAVFPIKREPCTKDHSTLALSLKGLQGGHSGMEIHIGRANALKLMCEFLSSIYNSFDIKVVNFKGGSARNAIPREAFCTITAPSLSIDSIVEKYHFFESTIKRQYSLTDPALVCSASSLETPVNEVITRDSFIGILDSILNCPNGVIAMSSTLANTVQTSNNCAMVNSKQDHVNFDCMLRSSDDNELLSFKKHIAELFSNNNASVSYGSIYPGWKPEPETELLSTMKKAYSAVHNTPPTVVAVHAGLECGIIGNRYPGMEIVSCGPTIQYAHSPDEQIHIASVERFWNCLLGTFEMLH